MRGKAEFTVEPFVDADPGPHVLAAIDEVRKRGFDAEIGPFGTAIAGDAAAVTEACLLYTSDAADDRPRV